MRVQRGIALAIAALLAACSGKAGTSSSMLPPPAPGGINQQSVAVAAGAASKITLYALGNGANDYYGFDLLSGNDGKLYYSTLAQSTCLPSGLCVSPSGNVGQFDPITHAFTELTISDGEPLGVQQTSDGAVWAAIVRLSSSTIGALARISPFTQSGLQEIALPAGSGSQPPQPRAMTIGADKKLWFTDSFGSRIGKISPAGPFTTAAMTMYAVPPGPTGTPGFAARPWGIAAGSDGNLWFSDHTNGVIYKSSTTGTMTGYVTPEQQAFGSSNFASPAYLALGGNGKMYFTQDSNPGTFESITHTGTFAHGPIAPSATPYLTRAGSGLVAFGDLSNTAVGIYNSGTGTFVELPVAPSLGGGRLTPNGVAVTSDGTVWFMGYGGVSGKTLEIGHITLTSTWSVFPKTTFSMTKGSTQLLGIAETGDSGPFTAKSANSSIASVANAVITGDDHNLLVNGVNAGATTITVTDAQARAVVVTVTVK